MNANELADELEKTDEGSGYLGVLSLEAATMLRQQQAEIEQWGVEFDKLTDDFMKQQTEIEALKKHNGELQKACVETLVWVMGNGGYCLLDIEVILKNVLGSEWEDYK